MRGRAQLQLSVHYFHFVHVLNVQPVLCFTGAIAEQKREDDALQRVSARKLNGFAQFDKDVQQQQAQSAI